MGERRVSSAANPRQELTAFLGIPRADELARLEPRIMFDPKIIKRVVADMHAPEAPK
jgi:hypothetical protein